MSRRHFVRIAAAMRELREKTDDPVARAALESAVIAIANVCNGYNTLFDYDVFYRACGLEVA